jgi:DNA-binding transcriptional ArsR family regulator
MGAEANAARAAGKPELAERPLVSAETASGLARLFKLLANDTRLRLVHALHREGEVCVTDLAARVEMTPQAVSNQLQRLVDRGILAARRDGNRVRYRIADPCVVGLLDLGFCLLEETSDPTAARTATAARR